MEPIFFWLNFPWLAMVSQAKVAQVPRFVLNPAPLLLKMVCEAMEQGEMNIRQINGLVRIS